MTGGLGIRACSSAKEFLSTANLATGTTVGYHPVAQNTVQVVVVATGQLFRLDKWLQLGEHLEACCRGHDVTWRTEARTDASGMPLTVVTYDLRPGSVCGCRVRSPRARAVLQMVPWLVAAAQLYPFVDPAYVPPPVRRLMESSLLTALSWLPRLRRFMLG